MALNGAALVGLEHEKMGEAKQRELLLVNLQLPPTWEVFEAQDSVGGFVQIAGPFHSNQEALDAYNAFGKHPEFSGLNRKLFIVRVERHSVKVNFDASKLGVFKVTKN